MKAAVKGVETNSRVRVTKSTEGMVAGFWRDQLLIHGNVDHGYLTSGTFAKSCRAVELVPILPLTVADGFSSRRILSSCEGGNEMSVESAAAKRYYRLLVLRCPCE